ncbi:MAG: putative flavoprotein involved in transport, partial [Solirubrobacteraceae bacterium]|nr:putative flavoprotein involved in transport [Solirubrobacteraceae bacterium]
LQRLVEIQRRDREAAAVRLGVPADAIVTVERLRRDPPRPAFPAPPEIGGHRDVVVVGGGQAGLSVSRCLRDRGIDHVVLERDRIASTWRTQRWDSFCLVTPNYQCRLPGHPYPGDDPDGFMVRDEIIRYVESYAAGFRPPLHEGVAVTDVSAAPGGGFRVATSHGRLTAGSVVLAVGGYHTPGFPAMARRLPAHVTQLHSSGYRNPESLPDGGVLVVGTGQSGAQIAEDLFLAGREVHVCVGSAPRVARFYRGRDCVAWLEDMGHYDMPITEHPQGLAARREANHYVTGRDGGRDIDLRAFARDGMRLHGRLGAIDGPLLRLAGDLRANLDAADATAERIKDSIDGWIESNAIQAPHEDRYVPVFEPEEDGGGTLDLDAAGIRTIVWATGFRSDWSWVRLPAFDDAGYPTHDRGVTRVPGLYVVGLPWLHTWGSGRFAGVARDAEHLATQIALRAASAGEARSAA